MLPSFIGEPQPLRARIVDRGRTLSAWRSMAELFIPGFSSFFAASQGCPQVPLHLFGFSLVARSTKFPLGGFLAPITTVPIALLFENLLTQEASFFHQFSLTTSEMKDGF